MKKWTKNNLNLTDYSKEMHGVRATSILKVTVTFKSHYSEWKIKWNMKWNIDEYDFLNLPINDWMSEFIKIRCDFPFGLHTRVQFLLTPIYVYLPAVAAWSIWRYIGRVMHGWQHGPLRMHHEVASTFPHSPKSPIQLQLGGIGTEHGNEQHCAFQKEAGR